jgi:hypothetical protein
LRAGINTRAIAPQRLNRSNNNDIIIRNMLTGIIVVINVTVCDATRQMKVKRYLVYGTNGGIEPDFFLLFHSPAIRPPPAPAPSRDKPRGRILITASNARRHPREISRDPSVCSERGAGPPPPHPSSVFNSAAVRRAATANGPPVLVRDLIVRFIVSAARNNSNLSGDRRARRASPRDDENEIPARFYCPASF